MARAGTQRVPGAELRYRIAGRADTDLPALVFENGWGASYHMWAWMERELAPHTRLLFYDRAGIGGSTRHGTQTVESKSVQLAALMDALGVHSAVVVGQSFGGLVCSAHAVQIPDRVCALVQIDPSVEQDDPMINRNLTAARWAAALANLLASLRLPDPLFAMAGAELPEADKIELRRSALRSPSSLRAARAELTLMASLRETARQPASQPRLVVSASEMRHGHDRGGRRSSVAERYGRASLERTRALHRAMADRGAGSRWESLPHTHDGLVFTRQGAADSAASTLRFVTSLV